MDFDVFPVPAGIHFQPSWYQERRLWLTQSDPTHKPHHYAGLPDCMVRLSRRTTTQNYFAFVTRKATKNTMQTTITKQKLFVHLSFFLVCRGPSILIFRSTLLQCIQSEMLVGAGSYTNTIYLFMNDWYRMYFILFKQSVSSSDARSILQNQYLQWRRNILV